MISNISKSLIQTYLMIIFFKGYRHVRLRSSTNQPLELSTLFIYSRQEEEAVELLSPHDMSALSDRNDRMDSKKTRSLLAKIKDVGDITRWEKEVNQ